MHRIGKLLKLCLLAFLFLAIALPAYPSERKTFTTIGRDDCQTWTDDRKKAASGTKLDAIAELAGKSWVNGVLSALNFTSGGKKDVLAVIDAQTIYIWIDRYCIQNPQDSTLNAATELFGELKRIAK